MSFPTWWPLPCAVPHSEREVLATGEEHAGGICTAIIESFGYRWYANAVLPQGGGNFGERVEDARAWCERICSCHPEKPGDRRSEPGRAGR